MSSVWHANAENMQRMLDGLAAGGTVVLEPFVADSYGDAAIDASTVLFAAARNRVGDRKAELRHADGRPSLGCIVSAEQARELIAHGARSQSGLRSLQPKRLIHLVMGSDGTATIANPDRPEPEPDLEILLGMGIVQLGERVPEGTIVEAVAIPWDALARALERDPSAMFTIDPRNFEEIVAAAYKAAGFDVTLTPRSGDLGRDVIATRRDVVTVRVLDQVKRYAPGRLVPAEDVRALCGVLMLDQRATHAVVSTTSDFAPGIADEFARMMPTRVSLRNGSALRQLIADLAQGKGRR